MTVESVVTEYVLNADRYKAGADQVIAASKKAANVANQVGEGFGKGIDVLKRVGFAAGLAAVPIIGFAKGAIDAALQFDTLKRSMNALTKDSQRTADILSFVQKLSLPSIYTQAQLGQASLTLEAFGVNIERFLPVAEKLGTVFGGTQESLDSFITSLGYLKSGRFGEAFESLARGGISRSALMGEGLKFDKGGAYLGSVEQAMNAVEKLVNEKFGQLSKEMASGPAAGLASLEDAFNQSMIRIGGVMLKYVVPVVKTLADAITNIAQSGMLEKITTGLMSLFDTKKIADTLISALAGILAGLEVMPKYVRDLANVFVKNFDEIVGKVRGVAVSLGTIFIAGQITQGILAFIKVLQMLRGSLIATAVAEGVMEASLTGGASVVKTVAGMVAAMAAIGAVSYGIAKSLDNMVGDIGKATGNMPSIQEFAKKKSELEKIMKGEATSTDGAGAIANAGESAGESERTKQLRAAEEAANEKVRVAEEEFARQRQAYQRAMNWAKLFPNNPDRQREFEDAQQKVIKARADVRDAKNEQAKAADALKLALQTEPKQKLAANGLPTNEAPSEQNTISDQLKNIAKATEKTADNTEKLNDISDRVLGGGTLTSRGLSRQELQDLSGSRTTGSKEIKGILVELGVAIERQMSMQTARAFGNNTSRREI